MSAWIQSTQGGFILGMGDSTNGAPQHFSYALGAFAPRSPLLSAWCCEGGEHMSAFPDSSLELDGQWHHIVGTIKNNDIAKLYVDGVLVATDEATIATAPWNTNVNGPFWIGDVLNANGDPFVGTIDDVKLFNHVLSESEVGLLFRVPEASSFTVVLVATITMVLSGRGIHRLAKKP